MQLVHDITELRDRLAAWRRAGDSVALVPTMGNLHSGHLELVRHAQTRAQRVVASVFVNPTQFGPGEDFDRYPRSLPQDRERLTTAGADLLFAPTVQQMYPNGHQELTRITVPGLSDILEGKFRPGHFDGVATVVNMLLNLVQPNFAIFGEKDYQQLLVIRRMAVELHLPAEIVGYATQRETDGLALSSRNQYLTQDERRVAPALFRALGAIAERIKAGERDFARLSQEATRLLERQGFRPQYVEVRAGDLSAPVADDREWIILAAAQLGRTRLIDNLRITI